MASFDCTGVPRCTVDFPLEITPEEIVSLSGPINTLLKTSYLLGTSLETDTVFDSLFDMAEEIAGVETCGFLLSSRDDPPTWEVKVCRRIDPSLPPERLQFLVAPAAIAAFYGKAISLDPEWGPWSGPICDAWHSRSLVSFPLRRERDVAGAIVFGKMDSHPFTPVQVKLLWALALQAENHLNRSESLKALSNFSYLDPLTHLSSRRYFDSQIEMEIRRSRRSGIPFSLLVFDLDAFKAYNDKFLHASGDVALQEFAGILSDSVREVDAAARLSGDEFAVILLESDTDGASSLADRIIRRFRRHLLPGSGETRTEHLSVSVGIASFPHHAFDKSDLLEKAYQALSFARSQGGDRAIPYHDAQPGLQKSAEGALPVRKIFDASRSVVDMDKFLEILLFTGMQGLGAKRGSIVVKESTGYFRLRSMVGFRSKEKRLAESGPIRPGPVTSWVVEHQMPLVVSNMDDSPLPPPQRKNGYTSGSFLSIPLAHAGRTLGAIHLTNRKDPSPFTREDLLAFAPIASQIAQILDQGIRFRDSVRSFSHSILSSLSSALELRYPFLSGHFDRVRDLSLRVAEHMGLGEEERGVLAHAAELHDVGIVGIPGNLLSLKRRLNEQELEMVRHHPFWGAKLMEGVPGMEAARRAILEHHENFDGSGYPSGLRGKDISLPARLLSVAEFYDSILTDRPYKEGVKREEAMDMVRAGSNTLFDAEVAGAFLEVACRDFPGRTDTRH